jgi:hypothetical protein
MAETDHRVQQTPTTGEVFSFVGCNAMYQAWCTCASTGMVCVAWA